MKQRLMLMTLGLALVLLLTGCMPQSGTVEPTATAKSRREEKRPELPADIQLDEDGVPQIRVYNVKTESVDEMNIEKYLEGVLAGEMKNDWPMEALKAQAILARTFVLKFISTKDSKYEGADISTDVAEAQAYDADAINNRIRTAVEQTRGLVMSDDGELPYAWFHAHSGGMTELPSAALEYEGKDPDYLEVEKVKESDRAPEDVKQWTAQFTKAQLQQACADVGVNVGSISSVTTLWMPQVVRYFQENYPKVKVEILDGNYDEIRDWIVRGQVDCGFISSILADDLKFYPLLDDPLCAVFPADHPLAAQKSVSLPELFRYPLIIETPGCDNDIQHLMLKCPVKPSISYSFRDDPLIMAFVRSGLGVTISQELVMQAFGCPGVVSRPLEPACCRTLGLAFSKTANSVVSRTLLEYLQQQKK